VTASGFDGGGYVNRVYHGKLLRGADVRREPEGGSVMGQSLKVPLLTVKKRLCPLDGDDVIVHHRLNQKFGHHQITRYAGDALCLDLLKERKAPREKFLVVLQHVDKNVGVEIDFAPLQGSEQAC